ncbi:hypothetical protein BDR07DRAFT_1490690 [Suillus spraguei]|nr:hypothetical protein BDR07DRAFT_1490690 [Suillus spraguei]
MAVGLLSLPTELICYILILLNPRDVSHCAMTCNTFLVAVRNSVEIQYKLEIYAQGLISTETATTKSDSISSKMRSFKKLASMWQSDFHANTIFETAVATTIHMLYASPTNPVCEMWTLVDAPGIEKILRSGLQNEYKTLPDMDLIVIFYSPHSFTVTNAEQDQDHRIFSVEFRLGSSHCPHPDAVCAYLECKHTFAAPGYYCAVFARQPIIRGDRIFVFYRMGDKNDPSSSGMFIQVINWRKGYAYNQNGLRSSARSYSNPGQRLEGLSTEGYFYVHIWDFNKRVIARSEYINDPKSPDLLICKPGPMPGSFGEDILPNHAYTATICHTPFPTRGSSLFLEQDRLTLTWAQQNEISIQVISSVQTEAETTEGSKKERITNLQGIGGLNSEVW